MGKLEYRVSQEEFNSAFGGLTASEAASLILGRKPLTDVQLDVLERASSGGQYQLRFDPNPVGHISFTAVATRGTGNSGWHILTPATPECRRLVNSARRAEFARLLGAPKKVADKIFSLVRGYEPVLDAAIAIWPLLQKCPEMTNRALREAGFRPGHPHEGAAISAIRSVLRSTS